MSKDDDQAINVYLIRSAFDKYGITALRTMFISYLENLNAEQQLPDSVLRDTSKDARTYLISDKYLYVSYYKIPIDLAVTYVGYLIEAIEGLKANQK